MKKLTVVTASSLLSVSLNIFADPHFEEALKHATAAAQGGEDAKIIEHTLPALEHTMAGALTAKGLTKTHSDAATKALESALDLARNKKTEDATASVKSAVEHLTAANKK